MYPTNNNRGRLKLLIGLVVFVVLVFLIIFTYTTVRFHIVSTSPSVADFPTDVTYFDINFNKTLSSSGFAVSSNPKVIDSYDVSGKSLVITLDQPLSTQTTYTITIESVYSSSGSHISGTTYVFKPKNVPFSQLPRQDQQILLQPQENYNKSVQANPLLTKLPFFGPGLSYLINYTLKNGVMIIEITAPSQSLQQAALTWIEGQPGVNVNSLNIQYITAQPQA